MDAALTDGVHSLEKAQGGGVWGGKTRPPDSIWKGGILILCGGMWLFEKLQCLLEGGREGSYKILSANPSSTGLILVP